MTVRASVVPRASLGVDERARMLALMHACYDGVDDARFAADLDDKQSVIVLRDARGGLVGFSTLKVYEEEHDGRRVDVVFSGDTVIDPAHWGSKALQTAFGWYCLARLLRRPLRPLYWLLLSKGFRTYLLAVNYFPRTFPKRGATPPSSLIALRDRIAGRQWPDAYDAARGVLRFPEQRERVRQALAPPTPETLAQPDVAFFHDNNPGHARGDELVCLVHLPLSDMTAAIVRAVAKALGARRRR